VPAFRDVVRRIDSIRNTQKITESMQVVAATRLKRAQAAAKDEDAEGRPSQLDQIRAAISDEPKPKKPREPKAK